MASCYHCGHSGATFRRNVQTGYSNYSWTSKRSFGSGSRTYYGLRSFCEDCAIRIDKGKAIASTLILFLIACGLLIYLIS